MTERKDKRDALCYFNRCSVWTAIQFLDSNPASGQQSRRDPDRFPLCTRGISFRY